MLQTFADGGSDYYMSVDEAQHFDQRPFRAMLVRRYIAYRPGRGFHLTKEGRTAWKQFKDASLIERSKDRFSAPLTAYFDAAFYGLQMVGGHKAKKTAEQKPARKNARMSGSVRDAINRRSLLQHSA
jgi:hypothetical protein